MNFGDILSNLKTGIFGAGHKVDFNTPTSYGSYYQQTEPNLIDRVKTLVTGQAFQPTGGPPADVLGSVAQTAQNSVPDRGVVDGWDYSGIPAGQGYQPRRVASPQPAQATPMPTAIPNGSPYDEIINQIFGDQSSNAFRTLQNENSRLDPKAENRYNSNGTVDRGIFQINSGTFNDFQRRNALPPSVKSFEDLFDALKNIEMAKAIYDQQGWDAWYGAPPDILSEAERQRRANLNIGARR